MKYIYAITVISVLLFASMPLWAAPWHDEPVIINNYITVEPTTTNSTTDVIDNANIIDSVSTINNYTIDNCQGVAEAQAAANNQMYMGTDKPQLSMGAGTCSESWATSLMFGMRLNDRMMLNGSWGHNYYTDVDSGGIGLLVIFK